MRAMILTGAMVALLYGGSAVAQQRLPPELEPDDRDVEIFVEEEEEEEGLGGAGLEVREKNDMRGLTLLVGAGVEGYTGAFAPNVDPGAAVAVTAAIKPSRIFGLEFGYSGAVNNLSVDVPGSGPDIVRNGGHAAITLGLSPTSVQPYVLGGAGVSRYNIRNGQQLGYQDDVVGNIPVGVGLRTHIGDFTADARASYNVLLGNQLAPGVADERLNNGRYMGTINLGGTF